MHTTIRIAALLSLLAGQAQAGSFRIDELAPDQGCECDCFLGLSRANARPDKSGNPPLIYTSYGERAELRLDGVPVILFHSGKLNKAEWYIYTTKDGSSSASPALNVTSDDRNGRQTLKGTLSITHMGVVQTLNVTGFQVCL